MVFITVDTFICVSIFFLFVCFFTWISFISSSVFSSTWIIEYMVWFEASILFSFIRQCKQFWISRNSFVFFFDKICWAFFFLSRFILTKSFKASQLFANNLQVFCPWADLQKKKKGIIENWPQNQVWRKVYSFIVDHLHQKRCPKA